MPEAEQERYMAALLKMMENKDGPETSPFFELAGYHGWPGNGNERMYSYCEHRQETFPGWHRAYLVAFEKGLQEADRALGNDGQIALPYWSVMDEPEVNGQVVPSILRKHFPNDTEKMRALLADPSVKGDGTGGGKRKELWERGLEIASDATIKRKVEMNRLPDMAARSMHTDPHWAAASQFRSSNKDSVETPHDRVHVYCEYPMMSLMHAAFYPGFWCRAAPRPTAHFSAQFSARHPPTDPLPPPAAGSTTATSIVYTRPICRRTASTRARPSSRTTRTCRRATG